MFIRKLYFCDRKLKRYSNDFSPQRLKVLSLHSRKNQLLRLISFGKTQMIVG